MNHARMLALAPLVLLSAGAVPSAPPGDFADGFSTITEKEVTATIAHLASQPFEGRDSPSVGLSLTARWIAARFAEYGLVPAEDSRAVFDSASSAYRPFLPEGADSSAGAESPDGEQGTYLRPWTRPLMAPVREQCSLSVAGSDTSFQFGRDFVPVTAADGGATGEVVFAGFGIASRRDKYDDFAGLDLEGKIALVFESEPRSKRGFGGVDEVTEAASLWSKLERLQREDVAGVLIVRRSPPPVGKSKKVAEVPLAFRFSYASWAGERRQDPPPRRMPPTLVVSESCAEAMLGKGVLKAAQKSDRSGKPAKFKTDVTVTMKAKTQLQDCVHDNVVGIVRGSDPALANEFIVLGAHYDHIGAGPRSRVGYGADDNASGTAALLEIAEALSVSPPRRSVCLVAFSAEEDGLLGSKAFCRKLPFEREELVAMVNLDMIGRGSDTEVVVLGLKANPKLEKLLDRALALKRTGVREFRDCRDDGLFQRSDHFSFHEILGTPTIFFFENYPVERNPDYHTWRDLPEGVSVKKVANTARLGFNTIWLLATEDERPPKAKR